MKVHSPTIPSPLGKMTPPSPANAEQLRAMRAAAWHKQGIVVVPLDDIFDAWDRASCLASPPSSTVHALRLRARAYLGPRAM